jgi:exodeoxyribonuclease (lambda-induced)
MSLYDKHIGILKGLTDVFGFDPTVIEQGSADWLVMRLGVLSASNADKIVAGVTTQGRQTYMASLIGDVCTCKIADEMPFKQLEHGKLYEPVARDALSVAMGFVDIKELPFMYKDSSMRAGVSPDGLSDDTVYEIKAPFNNENFFKFRCFADNKKAWRWQSQFQIWATGAQRHIFAQYEPRAVLCEPLHWIETEINEADQKTLSDAVPQFIADMDKALNSIGVTFGQHWQFIKQQRVIKND